MKSIGLIKQTMFEDINTYDPDLVIVDGNNRTEILEAITKLLTKRGIKMYGKLIIEFQTEFCAACRTSGSRAREGNSVCALCFSLDSVEFPVRNSPLDGPCSSLWKF